jgi:hypothetical protein
VTGVVIAVLLAAVAGIASERRWPRTLTLSRSTLQAILFVEVPFVSFGNLAHIRVKGWQYRGGWRSRIQQLRLEASRPGWLASDSCI